jgi:hypothetical protein
MGLCHPYLYWVPWVPWVPWAMWHKLTENILCCVTQGGGQGKWAAQLHHDS